MRLLTLLGNSNFGKLKKPRRQSVSSVFLRLRGSWLRCACYTFCMIQPTHSLHSVLTFWFAELSPDEWFGGSPALDKKISERFSGVHAAVAAGECWQERTTPEAYLAEVIVLDQFSRNMFRGTAQMFAYDGQALVLAQQVVASGQDTQLSLAQRQFLYLPFMHSESPAIHEVAQRLFESIGNKEAIAYEKIHKKIIDQFGRYPHRNAVLGRAETTAEAEYLATTTENFFQGL